VFKALLLAGNRNPSEASVFVWHVASIFLGERQQFSGINGFIYVTPNIWISN